MSAYGTYGAGHYGDGTYGSLGIASSGGADGTRRMLELGHMADIERERLDTEALDLLLLDA